jgi:uncharacterized coiled-coil protein SlyX
MAQIIKHRRGSLEALSAVTSSLQKGELVIASGSSNLSVTNGASIVFAVPENGQVQAVNRILVGDAAPNTFAAGTYNGMMKGVPYYASGSSTLYLLGEGANEIPNLVGNIQPFSASVATSINALSSSIGSGTIGQSVSALNTFSASTLVSLGELNAFSSSQLTKDSTLATYTGSVETRLTEVGVVSGSLIASASAAKSTNDTQDGRLTNLESTSASVNVSVAALNSTSASQQISIDALNSYTASNTSTTALNAFTASAIDKFTEIGVVSGSLIATSSNHEGRLDAIEAVSGTFARTNSGNVFTGTQVITGSLYITQDLVVYGSSSLFNVTASALDIGQNTIVLNTATPAVRFGGISVADSGSNEGASGSLFWDSLNNHWLYQHPSGAGEGYNSAILISGPKNTGALGEEATLTTGKITLAVGEDHIGDSIITQNGSSSISVGGDVIVTGSVTATSFVGSIAATNGVVSGSSQIDVTDTTNFASFSGSVSASIAAVVANVGSGVGVSITNLNSFTSSQLTQNSDLATYTASVETRLTEIGVVSGSLIASASAAKSTNDTQDGRLTNIETFSGSANSKFTEIGVVSGSLIASASAAKSTNDSQDVSITNLNSFSSSVLTQLTQIGVVSGSLISSASAAKSTNDTQDGRLGELESKSASVDIAIAALNSYTSSNTSTTALNAFTASAATKFTEIGVVSGSLISSASNADSRLTTLEGTGTIQGLGTGNNVTFAKVTTTGDVVVGGDLVVQGNTVTLNTAQLVVEDKVITLASGSTSNATADGAGFEIAGTSASFKYDGIANEFSSSVAIAANVTGSINLGSAAGSSKRVAFRNTNGNLDLVPTASVAGDLLQWDGNDFVMSNVIDGGSF